MIDRKIGDKPIHFEVTIGWLLFGECEGGENQNPKLGVGFVPDFSIPIPAGAALGSREWLLRGHEGCGISHPVFCACWADP